MIDQDPHQMDFYVPVLVPIHKVVRFLPSESAEGQTSAQSIKSFKSNFLSKSIKTKNSKNPSRQTTIKHLTEGDEIKTIPLSETESSDYDDDI